MFGLLMLLIVVGAVIGLVVISPSDYRVERSVLVYAPSLEIFRELDDLRRWEHWSPWEKLDPNLTKAFSGPATGIGASYAWSGNRRAGAGRMTIIESFAQQVVGLTIEFMRPFRAVCSTELSLRPDSGATRVTWTMTGTNGFIAKVVSLALNTNAMVGRDFDRGLTNLKSLCEAKAAQPTIAERADVDNGFTAPRAGAANSNAVESPEQTKH